MTIWIECWEKIEWHADFIVWRQQGNWHDPLSQSQIGPLHLPTQRLKMPWNPSVKAELICNIIQMYGAVDFADTLSDFIAGVLNDVLPKHSTQYCSENVYLPFSWVPVYHSMKFTTSSNPEESEIIDTIHTLSAKKNLLTTALQCLIMPYWASKA